jgi:hypothetical protein
MKKLICLAAALAPLIANAQIQVVIPLPVIRFEAPPPLVVVQPGVQVVEDYDDEVYFVDNWYWVRRDDHWFRARDHRGGWVVVERNVVPATIISVPRGKYRKYKVTKTTVVGPGGGVVKVKEVKVKHGGGGKGKH